METNVQAGEFCIKNGQCWKWSEVPVLKEELFRKKIMQQCAQDSRLVALFACLEEDQRIKIFSILGNDKKGQLSIFSMSIPSETPFFQSLTPELPQAHLFEREIAEQFAVIPLGHPWLKPVRYHSNYRSVPDLWPDISTKPIPGAYPFYTLESEEVHEVAVGPVHAGIIEPGHFRFQCHGEKILHLEIQLGYQHRGIEKMMENSLSERTVLLAESIAGDTVIGHMMAYCTLMESLNDAEISPRAEAIRVFALELERLANHIGDLGSLGTDIGFLSTAAYFGRLRGEFLNLLMELCGNRYGRSLCRPGGVLFDLDQEMIAGFQKCLRKAQKDIKELSNLFFTNSSVLSRLDGTGIVPNQAVQDFGFVGPTARACGYERDIRTHYLSGKYRLAPIPISTTFSGDVYARALLRKLEAQRSIEFLLDLLPHLPSGELQHKGSELKPNQMALAMVEGWRGEILHVVITDATSRIVRYKIVDPSFHNWMALSLAVKGIPISDFPLCNKSFSLSYAGHDL